jgi:hypothetical protein
MEGRIFALPPTRLAITRTLSMINEVQSAHHAHSRTAGSVLFALLLAGCGARTHVVATNPALSLSPVCADAVPVYPDAAHVPYDYYEIGLIAAEGNGVYTGQGDLLKSIRNEAAALGANGVIVDSLGTTHATAKIIGAAVGASSADRKGRAVAIWMPSDTTRVKEACAKK